VGARGFEPRTFPM